MSPMRLKLISCEVFYREMCWAAAKSPHLVDIEFLPKGLHDIGAAKMRSRLQQAIDAVDNIEGAHYDAILLGYGLCNNGLAGVTARITPLVLPRAHDCITLFLGSRQRYLNYFQANPGVYFKTTGWIDRGDASGELTQLSIQKQTGINTKLQDFIAKYGEDNGRYLFEMLGDDKHNYGQFTFIEMGLEPDGSYEESARSEARSRGWKFEKVRGDLALILSLVSGHWDDKDFQIVLPGQSIAGRYDEDIVAAETPEFAAPEAADLSKVPIS